MTPCIKQCSLREGICEGCHRTLDEIKNWRDMSLEDRMRIMKEIKYRRLTHDCPSCGAGTYCAMEAGKSGSLCWCMHVERSEDADYSHDKCLCEYCLTGE